MMKGIKAMSREKGFTLIEIMVALLVVGVLATFATTSYSDYTRRAQRAEARAILLEASQFMQRFYAVNNAYDKDRTGKSVALPASLTKSPRSGVARYNISLDTRKSGQFQFVLRADPVGSDVCGAFTLDNQGRMKAEGLDTARTSETACLR